MRGALFFFIFNLHAASLVFVHIGDGLPSHAHHTIQQAHAFNPAVPIYLLVNERAKEKLPEELTAIAESVTLESLTTSKVHTRFIKKDRFDKAFRKGFWSHTTMRFFYLYDFLKQFELTDVVHLENDVMLYQDIEELIPIFHQLDFKMASTFQYKTNCVPGIVYVKGHKDLKGLLDHIAHKVSSYRGKTLEADVNDMYTLATYNKKCGDGALAPLPVLIPEYADHFPKRDVRFDRRDNTQLSFLFQNSEAFGNQIFDAATYGIYLDGHDRRNNPHSKAGEIHYRSLYDPSKFTFTWQKDERGRLVPWIEFRGKSYRLINIHLHSKRTDKFLSCLKD